MKLYSKCEVSGRSDRDHLPILGYVTQDHRFDNKMAIPGEVARDLLASLGVSSDYMFGNKDAVPLWFQSTNRFDMPQYHNDSPHLSLWLYKHDYYWYLCEPPTSQEWKEWIRDVYYKKEQV